MVFLRAVKLVQHELGFFEAVPKPSREELETFYRQNYFGPAAGDSQYAHAYTADELELKRIIAEETVAICGSRPGRVLEVGYGEGFFLDGFARAGWQIEGIDFTDQGLNAHFPALRPRVTTGNVYAFLDAKIADGTRYDAVVCNNVLEHVLDPLALLRALHQLCAPMTTVRFAVPNDGSWLQRAIVERGLAPPDFWVFYPEHLSYFDSKSLTRALVACGFSMVDLLAEFPIDVFLLNPDTNYRQERSKGRNCHFARVAFELALARHDPDSYRAFRRACAAADVGRNLYAFVRPAV